LPRPPVFDVLQTQAELEGLGAEEVRQLELEAAQLQTRAATALRLAQQRIATQRRRRRLADGVGALVAAVMLWLAAVMACAEWALAAAGRAGQAATRGLIAVDAPPRALHRAVAGAYTLAGLLSGAAGALGAALAANN
jgi:hypothetical protein